jgi:hypothetical protein
MPGNRQARSGRNGGASATFGTCLGHFGLWAVPFTRSQEGELTERAITRIPATRSDLFAFEVSGRIERDDMTQMARTLEAAFTRHHKVDILILMKDWEGIAPGAVFDPEALAAQARANSHVRRYAVVGAPAWASMMINLFSPLTPVEERTFALAEEREAWAWVEGDTSLSGLGTRAGERP